MPHAEVEDAVIKSWNAAGRSSYRRSRGTSKNQHLYIERSGLQSESKDRIRCARHRYSFQFEPVFA